MQIEMTIKGLMVDPITNTPIVILRDQDGQRVLPIWVGIFEANAIASSSWRCSPWLSADAGRFSRNLSPTLSSAARAGSRNSTSRRASRQK